MGLSQNKSYVDFCNFLFLQKNYFTSVTFKDKTVKLDPLINSGSVFRIEFKVIGDIVGFQIETFGKQQILEDFVSFVPVGLPELNNFESDYDMVLTNFYGLSYGFYLKSVKLEDFNTYKVFCPLTENLLFSEQFKRIYKSSVLPVWEYLWDLRCGLEELEITEILGRWGFDPFKPVNELSKWELEVLLRMTKKFLYEFNFNNTTNMPLDLQILFLENKKYCKKIKKKGKIFWAISKYVKK